MYRSRAGAGPVERKGGTKTAAGLVVSDHVSWGASGGVSVRAGPSAQAKSKRVRARRERKRERTEEEVVRATGALLCSECGRLTWPDAGAASPHRMSEQTPQLADCPHCDSRAWIDLRRESTAIAIREGEQGVAAAESASVDILRKAGLGVVVGSFVGILATSSLLAGFCIAMLAGVAGGLAGVRLRRMSVPPKRTLPDRWSLALPPASEGAAVVEGVAEDVELLRSPLTGRTCVAFEVGLRQDLNSTGHLSSWALLEQRVSTMRIDGTPVEPAATFVEIPRESLGELAPEILDAAAVEWLLERGFTPVGSNLIAYESVVLPSARLSLVWGPKGAVLRPASTALVRPDEA